MTLHRPSNVDHQASLTTIMAELKRLAGQLPVVFPHAPAHPQDVRAVRDFAGGQKRIEDSGSHRLPRFALSYGERAFGV